MTDFDDFFVVNQELFWTNSLLLNAVVWEIRHPHKRIISEYTNYYTRLTFCYDEYETWINIQTFKTHPTHRLSRGTDR